MEDDADFAAVAGVDGRRAVGQRDRVLQRKSAPRTNLRLVARRKLDRESGRHEFRLARTQENRLHAVQIHARVFVRAVRVTRNRRIVTQLFYPETQTL